MKFSLLLSVYQGDEKDWLKLAFQSIINQTHLPDEIILKMLKNKNLKAEDKEEIGVVIESGSLTLSQNYTVLKLQKKVNLPCNAVMYNPEGKKLELKITELQSVVSKKIEKNLAKEGFYTLPYVPHAVASSKLFLRDLN